MSLFSDNLKVLRSKKGVTQQVVADGCAIPRDRYVKYEGGINLPPPDFLLSVSHYFHVSIDILLTVDLRKISVDELLKLGDNRILLPIIIDKKGNNVVEIIPHKAKAGYTAGGYADTNFISELDHIYLPWLNKNEKYRTFPVDGDSMPPHNNKSYIIGKYVEKIGDVVDGRTYIVITKNQEMVYKRLNKNGKNEFVMNSDNSLYKPYEIKFSNIAEIWEYSGSIERDNFKPEKLDSNSLASVIRKLQVDISEIKKRSS